MRLFSVLRNVRSGAQECEVQQVFHVLHQQNNSTQQSLRERVWFRWATLSTERAGLQHFKTNKAQQFFTCHVGHFVKNSLKLQKNSTKSTQKTQSMKNRELCCHSSIYGVRSDNMNSMNSGLSHSRGPTASATISPSADTI